MKVCDVLKIAALRLQQISTTPVLDAEILLAHALKVKREFLYAHSETEFHAHVLFDELMVRRLQGEPIAYILGKKEFWSLELLVTPEVLIPRPETELLVELALQKLDAKRPLKILDLGTGSGAIALALARERPNWEIFATDSSVAALEIAQQNAARLNLKVNFLCGVWFNPVATQQFDAIISNPPYVAKNDSHLTQLKYEPQLALVAGNDGLDALRFIIKNAEKYLVAGSLLMVEHGWNQSVEIINLMQIQGFLDVVNHQDLSQNPRVVVGAKKTKL